MISLTNYDHKRVGGVQRMLNTQDRVYQNIHGQDYAWLEDALKRVSGSNTQAISSIHQT